MGTDLIVGILALLTAFIGGGVVEHETKVITETIYYPIDVNQTECKKATK